MGQLKHAHLVGPLLPYHKELHAYPFQVAHPD